MCRFKNLNLVSCQPTFFAQKMYRFEVKQDSLGDNQDKGISNGKFAIRQENVPEKMSVFNFLPHIHRVYIRNMAIVFENVN